MKTTLWIPAAVVAVDQLIKYGVRQLPQGEPFFGVPGLFELVRSTNTGAAFSMLSGHTFLLAFLSAVLIIGLCLYIQKSPALTRPAATACLFLIGGGCGNLIDRLIHDGVTDYIRLLIFDFPIFNLADVAITLSAAVLIALLLTNKLEDDTGDSYGSDH